MSDHGTTLTPGAIMLGVSGLELTEWERGFLRDANPLGFILFARNVDNPDQLRRLTSDLREVVGRDAMVMVDQEGGRVQRLRSPHWTDFPAPLDAAIAGPQAAKLRYQLLGQELRAVGIDADAAPTLDVAREATHPFLFNRCHGHDADTVARMGRAVADGLLAAGVLPCMKHMPGHGLAVVDSHKDLPVVDASPDELAAIDFAPFKALADLPMGMTAHIRFTALDDQPATASRRMIGIIRQQIGFDGLLFSDDIGMNALAGTIGERAQASIDAGCDVVLQCSGVAEDMQAAVTAAGVLSSDAVRRADRALSMRCPPDTTDPVELRARLSELERAAGIA